MSVRILPAAPKLPDAVHVYTDGACMGNPGPMGIGVVILDPPGGPIPKEIWLHLGNGTNNIAELTAIQRGLQECSRDRPVVVYTDSQYALGVLAGGFRARANQELIKDIKGLLATFKQVCFVKVVAHAGVPYNERADQLARAGALRLTPDPAKAAASPPASLPERGGSGLKPTAKDPRIAALAARIEWLLCRDHRFQPPENPEQEADLEGRRRKYAELKSSSRSFEDSARLATLEWLEQVIGEFVQERAAKAAKAMDALFCHIQDVELHLKTEVMYRNALREVIGPDAFNDGWLAAFEQGGPEAVVEFENIEEERAAAARANK